jgi:hypothetical protein
VPGGNTRISTDSERSLKVTEHLGGKIVQRRHKDRVVEYSVELFQVGIEQVQVCTRELCFEFKREKCQGKTPTELLNTLVNRKERYFIVLNTLKERLNKECFEQVQRVHRTNTF